MAKKLGKEGFNVCIISRSEEKLKAKVDEIKRECQASNPGIQTKYIVADFCKMRDIKEYKTTIVDQLEGLDIGILALNAGVFVMGPFLKLTDEEVEQHVQVNVMHVAYLMKSMTDTLIERQRRTGVKVGVMVTSSGLGNFPFPGTAMYSASKSFATFIASALNFELKEHVDVIAYLAGEVSTKMLKTNAADSWQTISTEQAADASFRDLGSMDLTPGHFKQFMVGQLFLGNLPWGAL